MENRALNLERYDGPSTPWDQIEASLMTPPLFPGKKTLLVENVPYFLSQEKKGDLAEKVQRLWGEEKKEEAARLFLDLLVLEGWTQERWENAQGISPSPQSDGPRVDDESGVQRELDALFEFCRSRGMDLSRHRAGERHGLTQLLETGLPPWAVLLMTATHADRRTRLYRELEKLGEVLNLDLERDRSGRIKRESLAGFLDRHLKEAGKKIEMQVKEMILARAGGQFWSLHQELEKLLLYVGDDPRIKAQDVEEVFLDQADSWVFDLTDSVGQRNALRALEHLGRLLSQGEHPLRLLAPIAAQIRRLLMTRHLIEGEMRQRWTTGMNYNQFQRAVLKEGAPMITRHPFREYKSYEEAENFTTGELLGYLELIYRTDIRLKSSVNTPRLVMERLILEMCQGKESMTVGPYAAP
jgi:DNA polymerase-3 subunit delta